MLRRQVERSEQEVTVGEVPATCDEQACLGGFGHSGRIPAGGWAGGRLFGVLTGANLPDAATGFTRQLGIILDGQLYSAPYLRGRISSCGQITGNFTTEEVEELCEVLNAGTLPAPIRFVGRGQPENPSAEPASGDQ